MPQNDEIPEKLQKAIQSMKIAVSPPPQQESFLGLMDFAIVWHCSCGHAQCGGKYCTECGARRTEQPMLWDCPCGRKGNTSLFCPDCGRNGLPR